MRPIVVLRPVMPHHEAGKRTDPPVSVPSAHGSNPNNADRIDIQINTDETEPGRCWLLQVEFKSGLSGTTTTEKYVVVLPPARSGLPRRR